MTAKKQPSTQTKTTMGSKEDFNELVEITNELKDLILKKEAETDVLKAEVEATKNEVRVLASDLQHHVSLYNSHVNNLHM